MAVQPFHVPKFRAFTSNGEPLAGGLLYSYAAGTTTPLSTYTTRAGDVANANPVVLDANGEADVWVTPNVAYRFILKDSAGVTQWTVDSVPSLPDLSLVPLEIGDGTVTAPAISFINDPDCGLYRVGSETVGMATAGAQRQRWTTTGTVITGTAEVSGTLDVNGAANFGSNVALSGPNPSSTTGFADTITPKNLVKAWGRITTDGAGGVSVADGFNVASVSVTSANIKITFASAMANSTYAAVVTYHGTGDLFATTDTITSASLLSVVLYDLSTGTFINPSSTAVAISFIVLGAQ